LWNDGFYPPLNTVTTQTIAFFNGISGFEFIANIVSQIWVEVQAYVKFFIDYTKGDLAVNP